MSAMLKKVLERKLFLHPQKVLKMLRGSMVLFLSDMKEISIY